MVMNANHPRADHQYVGGGNIPQQQRVVSVNALAMAAAAQHQQHQQHQQRMAGLAGTAAVVAGVGQPRQGEQLRPRGTKRTTQAKMRMNAQTTPQTDPFSHCAACKCPLLGYLRMPNPAMKTTVALSCGHVLCPDCNYTMKTASSSGCDNWFTCRICLEPAYDTPLPTVRDINEPLCESTHTLGGGGARGASHACQQCRRRMCIECLRIHQSNPAHLGHQVVQLNVTASAARRFLVCPKHNSAITFRCDCGEMLCERCPCPEDAPTQSADGAPPRRHKRNPIETPLADIEDEMLNTVQLERQLLIYLKAVRDRRESLQQETDNVNNEIAATFHVLINSALRRCFDVMAAVRAESDRHVHAIRKVEARIEAQLRRVRVSAELDERARDRRVLNASSERMADILRTLAYAVFRPTRGCCSTDGPLVAALKDLQAKKLAYEVNLEMGKVIDQVRSVGAMREVDGEWRRIEPTPWHAWHNTSWDGFSPNVDVWMNGPIGFNMRRRAPALHFLHRMTTAHKMCQVPQTNQIGIPPVPNLDGPPTPYAQTPYVAPAMPSTPVASPTCSTAPVTLSDEPVVKKEAEEGGGGSASTAKASSHKRSLEKALTAIASKNASVSPQPAGEKRQEATSNGDAPPPPAAAAAASAVAPIPATAAVRLEPPSSHASRESSRSGTPESSRKRRKASSPAPPPVKKRSDAQQRPSMSGEPPVGGKLPPIKLTVRLPPRQPSASQSPAHVAPATATTADEVDDDEPVHLDEDGKHEFCYVCNDRYISGDEHIKGICDGCPRVFHAECHTPFLLKDFEELPDDWKCSVCTACQPLVRDRGELGEHELLVCAKVLLACFEKKRDSVYFDQPVDESDCPGYSKRITAPMDFGTIAHRLAAGQRGEMSAEARAAHDRNAKRLGRAAARAEPFINVQQFVQAMNQVFINCSQFNKKDDPVSAACRRVWKRYADAVKKWMPVHKGKIWFYVSLNGAPSS